MQHGGVDGHSFFGQLFKAVAADVGVPALGFLEGADKPAVGDVYVVEEEVVLGFAPQARYLDGGDDVDIVLGGFLLQGRTLSTRSWSARAITLRPGRGPPWQAGRG